MGQRDGKGDSGGRERYARIAAQWVQGAWREGPSRLIGASGDVVSVVERTLRRRNRRLKVARVTLRVAAGGAVVAAAAGVIVAWRGVDVPGPGMSSAPVSGAAPPKAGASGGDKASAQGRASLDPHALAVMAEDWKGGALVAGSRVSAPARAPLRIASGEGTSLTLDPGSSLTIVDLGQVRRFTLLHGAVRAQVKKLVEGQRFIIDTADAEVEVRGTAFRVETGIAGLGCPQPSEGRSEDRAATRVVVEEGVVSVRAGGHAERLHPGESWSTPCVSGPVPRKRTAIAFPARRRAGGVSARAKASVEERPSSRAADAAVEAPAAARGSSELSEQNDLFSAAVAARKAGDSARALELFERLIDRYPQSSLVEGAMAATMRLLAASHPARAAPAAAAYLSRFPDGFARAEAAALLRGSEQP